MSEPMTLAMSGLAVDALDRGIKLTWIEIDEFGDDYLLEVSQALESAVKPVEWIDEVGDAEIAEYEASLKPVRAKPDTPKSYGATKRDWLKAENKRQKEQRELKDRTKKRKQEETTTRAAQNRERKLHEEAASRERYNEESMF